MDNEEIEMTSRCPECEKSKIDVKHECGRCLREVCSTCITETLEGIRVCTDCYPMVFPECMTGECIGILFNAN